MSTTPLPPPRLPLTHEKAPSNDLTRTKCKSACLHWTERRAPSALVDKMITLNVNQGFGWGPSCNLTVVSSGWAVSARGSEDGGGCHWAFWDVGPRISSQIDHVATSEFHCQSALNINDSARKRARGKRGPPALIWILSSSPLDIILPSLFIPLSISSGEAGVY